MENSSCAINGIKPNSNTSEHICMWCLGYDRSANEKQEAFRSLSYQGMTTANLVH